GDRGIGRGRVGSAGGYRTVSVIPEAQTQEKMDTLRQCGAEVRPVPAVPYRDPNNYVKVSGRLAEELNESEPDGAIWANQFDNTANRKGHYETTAPEIWVQTDGTVDAFICAIGTGGTLAGVSTFLRERKSDIVIGMADPHGSALFNYYAHGELKVEGSSITEGIGNGRITANLDGIDIDEALQIPDAEALPHLYDLLKHEGLMMGTSSAINLTGAIRLAEKIGPGQTIVTVLCDYGSRYASNIYNPAFLKAKGLPCPDWLA
ncbi:MAG: cysteine synthase A, partial [bacterium]|nr:cysteine synthase A [bacterium]